LAGPADWPTSCTYRRQEDNGAEWAFLTLAVAAVMAGLVGDLVVRAVGVAASMALGFLVLAELLSMQ